MEETYPEYVYRGPSERVTSEPWSVEEDQTFIRAHKEGKTLKEIAAMLSGRTRGAVKERWHEAKLGKAGTAALRAYAAELTPSEKPSPWSAEEDQTFIRAHKEGKTMKEIAAMLPGRTGIAVGVRWSEAKSGNAGTAALREYAAECAPEKRPWSVEEDQTFIRAHREGKTHRQIAAMLPGRTEGAVGARWKMAKCGKAGSAALREYAAECTTTKGNSWSEEEDQTFIQTHREGKTFQEIVAMLPRRTEGAVEHRWMLAKKGKAGTAALTAYAAECIPSGRYSPWSVEEDMTIIRAHKEAKHLRRSRQCSPEEHMML